MRAKHNTTPPTVADDQWSDLQVDTSGSLIVTEANSEALNTKFGTEYETVAASQTDQVLGATGATGDLLETLIIVVATAATAQVDIKDGAGSAINVLPNSPGDGIGVYVVPLKIVSVAGAWSVTTGAGSSVIATGNFT